jgi:hypothetical protein
MGQQGEVHMVLSQIGIAVLGFGAAVYFGEGGVTKGAEEHPALLQEYRAAKKEKREPTSDQKNASHTHFCYLSGGYLMACGAVIYLVSNLI